MSNQFIFNQYYIDLIKRIKTSAKKMKEDGDDEAVAFGKTILKAIRENYTTLDKSSDEYTIYMRSIPEDFWASYIGIDDISVTDDWFLADDVKDVCVYKNITVSAIRKLVNDDYMCHHFFSVFYLFMSELSDDDVKLYLSVLQDTKNEIGLDGITNESHKKLIARLNELKTKKKETTGINMAGMEDTMLGKLAKEILEDVDVEKLQKSIGDNGDILKAIGDPDSGFSELISNVSRKMASKISSGELKQENLLQDAIKFASVMPGGIFGNAGANGNNQGASKQGGGGNPPDMASMMNMMSSMMNNKEGMDMFKNMMGNQGQRGGSRQTVNKPALKKLATVNKLKSKLAKRREGDE
uniref:Uncharacterized protein n=1 Tax=viral metagenome TaxID=1070528 RepID=A0A6C0LFH4_9ZZZZ